MTAKFIYSDSSTSCYMYITEHAIELTTTTLTYNITLRQMLCQVVACLLRCLLNYPLSVPSLENKLKILNGITTLPHTLNVQTHTPLTNIET